MQPASLTLRAQRWVPFVYTIDFADYDLSRKRCSGGTFRAWS